MPQITTGLRAALSSPRIYDLFQDIMGARTIRFELVNNHIHPFSKCRILDVGCGTAKILDFFPEDVNYYGFDLSQRYIDDAANHYGARGHFNCALVEQTTLENMEPFDFVIAVGLLHHLDDAQAGKLMGLAWSALRVTGKLITIDPCFSEDQNAISRFLVSHDRGQNVRTAEQYHSLANTVFPQVKGEIKHRTWIPYTHWIMKCQK